MLGKRLLTYRARNQWDMRNWPHYVPKLMRWNSTYTFGVKIAQAAGIGATDLGGYCKLFRLNSLKDPSVSTGVGDHSVLGFGLMNNFYMQYRVYACEVVATFRPIKNYGYDLVPVMALCTASHVQDGNPYNVTDALFLKATPSGAAAYLGMRSFNTNLEVINRMKQGAFAFPGYNVFKPINYGQFGFNRTNGTTTVKMRYSIAKLGIHSESFSDWAADKEWEALFTADPIKERFCGIYCGLWSDNLGSAIAGNQVPEGYLTVKIKYKSLLSQPRHYGYAQQTQTEIAAFPDAPEGEAEGVILPDPADGAWDVPV